MYDDLKFLKCFGLHGLYNNISALEKLRLPETKVVRSSRGEAGTPCSSANTLTLEAPNFFIKTLGTKGVFFNLKSS